MLRLKAKLQSNFKLNLPGLKPQSGQALLIVVFALLVGTMLLGLVVEVGHLYITKRGMQGNADAAAAYGAMQLDIRGVRDSDGGKIENNSIGDVTNPTVQGQRVEDFLAQLGYGSGEYTWEWRRCQLKVSIKRNVPTIFVSIFGVRATPVEVSSKAVIFDNPNGCD